MIIIYGEMQCYDISFYCGQNEKYYDNGKEFYLLEIREWKGNKCVNMYHKYILADTTKGMSLTILTELFKEKNFVELLINQRKIVDMGKVIKEYILGVGNE